MKKGYSWGKKREAQLVVWKYQWAMVSAFLDILLFMDGNSDDLEEVLEEAEEELVKFFWEIEKHLEVGEEMKEYWEGRFSRAKDFAVLGGSQEGDEGKIRRFITGWEGGD